MEAKTLNLLLLVAAILGIIQGMMTLIGGCVAAEDKSVDDLDWTKTIGYAMRLTGVDMGKYYCGLIRGTGRDGCSMSSLDRGWFRRVYDAVKDDGLFPQIDKDPLKKLAGYEAVLSYAIICGVGWMAAGVLALMVSLKPNKMLALVAGIIFSVLYCLHVALFGAIWDSVLKIDDNCKPLYDACNDFKKQVIRSANEFLAYAICAFFLILYCIIACFLYYVKAEKGNEEAPKVVSDPLPKPVSQPSNSIPPPIATPLKQEDAMKSSVKVISPEPKAPEKKQEVAPATAVTLSSQFKDVNRYLVNDAKLTKSVNKEFANMDKDGSGKINVEELKKFITDLFAKKKLPPPDDKRIAALLNKYDADKSQALEKEEFKKMMHDIFMSSREALIKKYGAKKAEEIKKSKSGPTDASGAEAAEKLIKSADALEAEIAAIAKVVDKDHNSTLSIDETVALAGKLCEKFKFPVLTKDEISGIMKDMDREISEYTPKDLRMVCLAILVIGKTIVKP